MMNFLSFSFLFFMLFSLFAYYSIPKKYQWIILLVANTVFYAFSGVGNFVFILTSSFVSFICAKKVFFLNQNLKSKKKELSKEEFKAEKQKFQTKKRTVLVAMLFINVGILIYLKYINFLGHFHKIFLPLGISYYTLQTIAYFMDVYNSKYEAEKNFIKYFMFISFFPQLIIGPINRFNQLGKQMQEEHEYDFENIKHGVMLVLYGALKKYLVADMLVGKIALILDPNFENMPGCLVLFGILMYAVYQYADFSGGVHIVLGFAKMFGLDMAPNFRQPYFSTSLANFWQRWHMSLGSWMRDYVFYPLALTKGMQNISKWCGTKLGKHFAKSIPACIANIAVFLLVGIWHGPELHFFIWGLYNGLIIALSDLLSPVFEKINFLLKINVKSKAMHIFRIIRTFIIVNIGWYFDRIVDVPKSFRYLKNTFTYFGNPLEVFSKSFLNEILGHIADFESQIVLVVLGCAITFTISMLQENKIDVYKAIQKKNIAFRWACYYIPLFLIILSFSFSAGDAGFMYAQY
ncbi:MAG: MBOAT family O-acyltransferase [Treponema sp.]|nr:MBOAT family protein [Spirochaetia bacterium]MDY5683569.1 MBOAT family O-acyltransferase [Treponema sp.]